jgi:uncharacterized iron-regulated membrane protein
MRKVIARVHRWFGVVMALYVVLIALSGSVLIWHREIDAMLNPALMGSAQGSPAVELEDIVRTAKITGAKNCSINMPDQVYSVYRAVCEYAKDGRETVVEIAVAPTGERLGYRFRDVYGLHPSVLVNTIYSFHSELLIGPSGRNVVGTFGIVLLLMVGSGIVNWWPRRKAWRHGFRFPLKGPAKRLTFNAHRIGGLYSATLLLAATISGLYLTFPNQIDAGVALVSDLGSDKAQPRAVEGNPRPLSEALDAVHRTVPHGRVTGITMPQTSSGVILFDVARLGDARKVYGAVTVAVDPVTAKVVAINRPEDMTVAARILALLFPIHTGEALGFAGRFLNLIGGLSFVGLAGSGFWLWRRKKRNRSTNVTFTQNL